MDRNCFLCSKIGHMTRDCPNADLIRNNKISRNRIRNNNEKDPKELQCYNCNNYGHLARDCQEQRNKPLKCYKCNQNGHLSKECSTPQQSQIKSSPIAAVPLQKQNNRQIIYPNYSNSIKSMPPIPLAILETSFSKKNQQQQLQYRLNYNPVSAFWVRSL